MPSRQDFDLLLSNLVSALIFEGFIMITNANAASHAQARPEFEIKDSLLADALERNQLTLPPRLQQPSLSEHPQSKSEVAGSDGAS